MFFIDLCLSQTMTSSTLNSYNSAKFGSKSPGTHEISRNEHTKNFCHLRPQCVNLLVTTQRVNALARNALVMSGVSSAMEITLPTPRAVRSIRTSKKTYTLPQCNCNKHCTPSLESLTPKSQSTIPAILPHKILPTSPLSPNSLLAISTT
jgi:hypothetical protein